MDASVRALQDMIDGLFDISTLDFEQAQFSATAFPVEGILDQLRHSLSALAAEKGLRLRVRPSGAWVQSNPDLLHRVLLNLANNAVRYTPSGSVLVACRPTQDGAHLRIEVRDSGIGIDPQHHEEIFQEFFQVGNVQRDRSKGMGIGLSIVARACSLLNHSLHMQSALGQGTRFILTVPLAQPGGSGSSDEAARPTGGDEFNGLQVLLIEDDELGRVALASLLQSWGFAVLTAEDAQAACAVVASHPHLNLIVTDYRLGGELNGMQAIDKLNAIAGRTIAACLISGDTDAHLSQRVKAAGLTLLQKPVRPAKLRNLLRHLVRTPLESAPDASGAV
jgi:CheY-like chemotaxis protein/anti-sigma regulatory factor (Ser/Thr protein kinase)